MANIKLNDHSSHEASMNFVQPNKTMYMRPENTPQSAWLGHIPFAGWLVEAIKPQMIVELGTHQGASYLAMCQAVEVNGLDTRCFAVDTWEGDAHAGVYGESVYAQLDGYHARKYSGFSRLMRMTFDTALEYFAEGSVDLLHIDGLHTYEAVRHDFESWLPKLSPRGVILFHDTCVRERDFGVWQFWREISKQHPSFEFTHTHGLGVLAVGAKPPPSLLQLLEAGSVEKRVMINMQFERLGRTIEADSEIKRLSSALEHEYSLKSEHAAATASQYADLLREQIHLVRADIVYAENLLLAGQSESRDIQNAQLLSYEDTKRQVVARTGELSGLLCENIHAMKDDISSVRDNCLSSHQELRGLQHSQSTLIESVHAEYIRGSDSLRDEVVAGVNALRLDAVAIRDQLLRQVSLAEEGRQQLACTTRSENLQANQSLLEELDAMAITLAKVDKRVTALHEQGIGRWLQRVFGSKQASSLD